MAADESTSLRNKDGEGCVCVGLFALLFGVGARSASSGLIAVLGIVTSSILELSVRWSWIESGRVMK